jgi:hypothetical protein
MATYDANTHPHKHSFALGNSDFRCHPKELSIERVFVIVDSEKRDGSRSKPHIAPPARFSVDLNISFLFTNVSIDRGSSSLD